MDHRGKEPTRPLGASSACRGNPRPLGRGGCQAKEMLITRLAAPRGRFEAGLPPGGGAITADWRESQKVAKRA